MEESTIAVLCQYGDVVPVGLPTTSYRLGDGKETPSMDGLYDAMTPDLALLRLRQLRILGYRM